MAVIKKMGLLPESPVYIGDRAALEMDLSIITYDSSSAHGKQLSNVDELPQYQNDAKILWINISGLKDIDSIKRMGELYNIHPLSIEDILHTEQQPKIEMFEKYWFLSIKTIQQTKNFPHEQETVKKNTGIFGKKKESPREEDEFLIDQISIIVMKNVIMTFQETSGDPFNNIRKRILDGIGEIRKMGTNYLTYAIIDAVVDEYFLALDHLEEDIEDLEERATKTNDITLSEQIQKTKKYLSQIKRAISPLKENLTKIPHLENFIQTDELKPFLQDLNENLNNATIMVDNHREWLANIMSVNLSVLSHQMNKVMKVLAIISTIFIPLTFIAGVYGMNFQNMPELGFKFGYPLVLGGMGIIALLMILFFKIRHWF